VKVEDKGGEERTKEGEDTSRSKKRMGDDLEKGLS